MEALRAGVMLVCRKEAVKGVTGAIGGWLASHAGTIGLKARQRRLFAILLVVDVDERGPRSRVAGGAVNRDDRSRSWWVGRPSVSGRLGKNAESRGERWLGGWGGARSRVGQLDLVDSAHDAHRNKQPMTSGD